MGMVFRAPDAPDYQKYWDTQVRELKKFQDAGLPICLEFGHDVPFTGPMQPMGVRRMHLKEEDGKPVNGATYPGDAVWLPSFDPAFKAWVKRLALEYGWPKGPINAMKIWNEPWEGASIAVWGADMLRYREIFTVLCEAVEEGRQEAGVQILLGGADSSSNTMDKHFPDGDDRFLKWTDFMSIHYQSLLPAAGIRLLADRKVSTGRTLVWDTESWCANSDERIASILPSMYAAGHDSLVGIHSQHVVSPTAAVQVRTDKGTETRWIAQALSVGAAVGALQQFIGDRAFERILFRGLPLVYVFTGLPGADGKPNPEDGTLALCADLAPVFGQGMVPFRSVKCLDEIQAKRDLHGKLAGLAPLSAVRLEAEKTWRQRGLFSGARYRIVNPEGRFRLYDGYGNPIPAKKKMLEVPVNADGYYLRADGKPGSFAALLAAVEAGRLEGLQPVEFVAHDLLAPVAAKPAVKVELRNLTSRPLSGKLSAKLGALKLDAPAAVALAPREHKTVELRVTGGEADPVNAYALSLALDCGADGLALHDEVLRCNVIARRAIQVDGNLADWQGALPQTLAGDGTVSPNLQAKAWWPDQPFPTEAKKGLASVWLAYDDKGLYLAAKIADDTPHPGTLRMTTRDDDQFFYPETTYVRDAQTKELKPMTWPAGVRRYSYRGWPILPANAGDNLQIGFNALSDDDKPWYPAAPGTWKGFAGYWSTDYEYALNQVAEASGGGTSCSRSTSPCPSGASCSHYPRTRRCTCASACLRKARPCRPRPSGRRTGQ